MSTLPQRVPPSHQLALSELPGAVKRVPPRALAVSAAALVLAAWGALSGPDVLAGYDALSWLLALVPAFLLAYYRGWRGATFALAVGMAFLTVVAVVAEPVLGVTVEWPFLFLVTVVFVAVGLGVGALSELLQRERRAALVLAYSDPLTGLPNRRLLDVTLRREFAAARRGRPLSVVLFDVDGFRAYNEAYGHREGDRALQEVAALLDRHTRRMNLSGRYGGDEFLCVLSGERPPGATIFAERIRAGAAALALPTDVHLTVSAGLASYDPSMLEPGDLVDAADRALARAKATGGNRYVAHVEPAPAPAAPTGAAAGDR
jgi:diguanylate cyclase (GGDEF)-like protein